MYKEIRMPKLGESVVEGVIIRWLKRIGEVIQPDEPLVEIETDKVSTEIPSTFGGRLVKVFFEEGRSVPVGEVICAIDDGSKEENPSEEGGNRSAPGKSMPIAIDRSKLYSPTVRRLSQEHGIDLEQVEGSGLGGRITKNDVLQIVAAQKQVPSPSKTPVDIGDDEILPLTRMRKSIAVKMVHSKATVPHAWTMVEVDVTDLVNYRESVKEVFRKNEGVNLTYFPFVIKAAVEGLKEYPILNSMWQDDRIVIKKRINIGVAVDLEDGLIVPVVKNADQKSIAEIAKAIADLATRARKGQLRPEDVEDGTFTVNNTGAFGSIMSAPIINHPQAAIMSMETITKRPVVINDAIAIRSMLNICISLDHRILDGAVCGRFLRVVKKKLESYNHRTQLY